MENNVAKYTSTELSQLEQDFVQFLNGIPFEELNPTDTAIIFYHLRQTLMIMRTVENGPKSTSLQRLLTQKQETLSY